MNRVSPLILFLLATVAVATVAQTPRRRSAPRTSAKPAPTPAPSTAAAAPASDSPTLAIVNELAFTAADIEAEVSASILSDPDLYLHDFYQDREKAIREARQRAVDVRVSSMLIAAEGKKRGTTSDVFLDAERNQTIAPPTDA